MDRSPSLFVVFKRYFSNVKSVQSRRSYICFVLKKKSKWLRGSRVKPLALRFFLSKKIYNSCVGLALVQEIERKGMKIDNYGRDLADYKVKKLKGEKER